MPTKTYSLHVAATEPVREVIKSSAFPYKVGEESEGEMELIFNSARGYNDMWSYLFRILSFDAFPRGVLPDLIELGGE